MIRAIFCLFALLAVAGCGRQDPAPKSEAAAAAKSESAEVKRYPFHGKIIGKDPMTELAMIQHDAVKDYMDAMTMSYKIPDEKLYESLKPGDEIDATLVVQADGFTVHLENVKRSEKAK